MRSQITKELKKAFAAEMQLRLPSFERVTNLKVGQHPKWVWKLSPDLQFFIKLQPLRRDDYFVLEIAWTDTGELGTRENYQLSVNVNAPRWGARLANLWKRKGDISEQVWDIAPKPTDEQVQKRLEAFDRHEVNSMSLPDPPVEDVLPRIVPLVRDAVDKIEQYALPVFKRVAEARGYNWPLGNNKSPASS